MKRIVFNIIITLGLACGLTVIALTYTHNIDSCRAMVIEHEKKHQTFSETMAGYEVQADFVTVMTRGK